MRARRDSCVLAQNMHLQLDASLCGADIVVILNLGPGGVFGLLAWREKSDCLMKCISETEGS